MTHRIAAALIVILAAIPGCTAPAETAAPAQEGGAGAQEGEAVAPFLAADFVVPTRIEGSGFVPTRIEGSGFVLVPLGPELAEIDYEAYMSSIEHLQQTFTRSTGWPGADLDAEDAMKDMLTEQARFEGRESFAYAVLTPDGTRERGCVYVYPSEVEGHDAVVRLWVTKAEYDAGFDADLYEWTQSWITREWPFEAVAYPGRAIEWSEWDKLVEAAKPG